MSITQLLSWDLKFLKVCGYRFGAKQLKTSEYVYSLLVAAAYLWALVKTYWDAKNTRPVKSVDDLLLIILSALRVWNFICSLIIHHFVLLFQRKSRSLLNHKLCQLERILASQGIHFTRRDRRLGNIYKLAFVIHFIQVTFIEAILLFKNYNNRTVYVFVLSFGIFISFENVKAIYAHLSQIHSRICAVEKLASYRNVSGRKLSTTYIKLQEIVELSSSSFSAPLVAEIFRFFIVLISHAFYLALRLLVDIETPMRFWLMEVVLRTVPGNVFVFLIIKICESIKTKVR